jgi:hypothetical protein
MARGLKTLDTQKNLTIHVSEEEEEEEEEEEDEELDAQ